VKLFLAFYKQIITITGTNHSVWITLSIFWDIG
jgi:hypothetical protein